MTKTKADDVRKRIEAKIDARFKLFEIALQLHDAGLPKRYVVDIIKYALRFSSFADLVRIWSEETDPVEKESITYEILELLEDFSREV